MHSRPPISCSGQLRLIPNSTLNGRRAGPEIPYLKCNYRFLKFGGKTISCGKLADLSKAGAKRCMNPEVALSGRGPMSDLSLLCQNGRSPTPLVCESKP